MFSGTIAENMRNVKQDATDEEIIDALKLACAWDFVEKLPDGIESVIKERGGGFSEGQAQRLSIARALLRKSPIPDTDLQASDSQPPDPSASAEKFSGHGAWLPPRPGLISLCLHQSVRSSPEGRLSHGERSLAIY